MKPETAIDTFSTVFETRYSEVTDKLVLSPVALFSLMVESAIRHCSAVDRSITDLFEKGWGWFLMQFRMRVTRYPAWRERIVVHTWPYNLNGLYAVREFVVTDEHERTLCIATSRWILIDLNRRRPIRIPAWIAEAYKERRERVIDDPFEEIPAPEKTIERRHFHVRRNDLDSNQHATSSCYVAWMLESVPIDASSELMPREVEISFRQETRYGDEIEAGSVLTSSDEKTRQFSHILSREHDTATLAVGRSIWADLLER